MTRTTPVTLDSICSRFGFPRERVIENYKANIADRRKDLEKAKAAKNGKYRGATVQQLESVIAGLEAVLRT